MLKLGLQEIWTDRQTDGERVILIYPPPLPKNTKHTHTHTHTQTSTKKRIQKTEVCRGIQIRLVKLSHLNYHYTHMEAV